MARPKKSADSEAKKAAEDLYVPAARAEAPPKEDKEEVEIMSSIVEDVAADEVFQKANQVADLFKSAKELANDPSVLHDGSALGIYEQEQETADGLKRKVAREIRRGSASRDEKVILLAQLIGEDLVQRCKVIANGRNVHVLDMLVPGIEYAFDQGGFEAHGASEPRTGRDEVMEESTNVTIQEVFGKAVFIRIRDHARGLLVSNKDALKHGLQHAIEAASI